MKKNSFAWSKEKEGGGQREEGTTWAGEENRGLHEDPRVLPLWDVLPRVSASLIIKPKYIRNTLYT